MKKIKSIMTILDKNIKSGRSGVGGLFETSLLLERDYLSKAEILQLIDNERVVGADTKEEQLIGQGRNQAYDIIEKYIKDHKCTCGTMGGRPSCLIHRKEQNG